MTPRIVLVLLCFVVAANAQRREPAEAKQGPSSTKHVHDTMAAFAAQFEILEDAIEPDTRRDKRALELACREIERAALALADAVEHPSTSWRSRLLQVHASATRIRESVASQSWPVLREVVGSLRTSCVTCHARFQDSTKNHSETPARRNTIHGRVTVTDKSGKPRENLSNLVVFIDAVPGKWPPLREQKTLSQKNRSFLPAVLPIVVGGEVDFPNDDLILHNVFSLSKTRVFDLGMYGAGKSKTVRFDKKGLVRVYCNIHPDMAAHILVLANPYFAKTGPDGEWALTDIPNGTYDIRVWSAYGGQTSKRVELANDSYTKIELSVRDTAKRVAHKNKFGRSYRGKYGRE